MEKEEDLNEILENGELTSYIPRKKEVKNISLDNACCFISSHRIFYSKQHIF